MQSFMKKFTQVVDTCISIIDSFKRKPIFEQEDELFVASTWWKKEDNAIIISSTSIMHFWLYGLLIVGLGVLLFFLKDIIYLSLIAFVLAVATETFIVFFSRWIPRFLAILVSYLLVIVFLLSWVLVLVPFIAQQSTEIGTLLIDQISLLQQNIQTIGLEGYIQQSRLPDTIKETLVTFVGQENIKETLQSTLLNNVSQIATFGSNYLGNVGVWVVSFLTSFFKLLSQIGIVFIIAIFMSLEKNELLGVLASFSANSSSAIVQLQKLYQKLWYWLEWQLFLSLYIFIMVYVGLWILSWIGIDLPNKFTLALISWLFEFLPYIGPFFAWFAGMLVAFLAFGWKGMIITRLMYFLVQRTENNILIPTIMSKTLWASPLLILLCAIAWVSLFGIVGVLLAVPLAVIIMIYTENLIKGQSLEFKRKKLWK